GPSFLFPGELAAPTDGQDIKSASAGPDAIVYEELGSIHLFDPATGKTSRVEIRVAGDFPAARPHFEPVAKRGVRAAISPTGARAVFEAHGEILTVPAGGEATGTPVSELFGQSPTGRSFKTISIDVFTVRGDKLASAYHVENWVGALEQIR